MAIINKGVLNIKKKRKKKKQPRSAEPRSPRSKPLITRLGRPRAARSTQGTATERARRWTTTPRPRVPALGLHPGLRDLAGPPRPRATSTFPHCVLLAQGQVCGAPRPCPTAAASPGIARRLPAPHPCRVGVWTESCQRWSPTSPEGRLWARRSPRTSCDPVGWHVPVLGLQLEKQGRRRGDLARTTAVCGAGKWTQGMLWADLPPVPVLKL